jgi:hypothetical protein
MKLADIARDDPGCRHVWEMLDALGDEDPGPAALSEIAGHFAQCSRCIEAEAALDELLALYRKEDCPPAPSGVEERLLEAMLSTRGPVDAQ